MSISSFRLFPRRGSPELSFTVPKDDLRRAMTLAEVAARDVDAGKVTASGDIAKISIVGLGMRSHAGVAHRMFDALARRISIQMIGTSEIKVSVVIDMRRAEDAVEDTTVNLDWRTVDLISMPAWGIRKGTVGIFVQILLEWAPSLFKIRGSFYASETDALPYHNENACFNFFA